VIVCFMLSSKLSVHRRVCPILDLDPVRRSAGAIAPVAPFRDQALEAQAAGGAEQLGADLARLEGRDEHAIGIRVVSQFEMFLMNPIAVSRWWSSSAGQAKVVLLVHRPQLPQNTVPQSLHLKILNEPSGIIWLQVGQHFIARIQGLIPGEYSRSQFEIFGSLGRATRRLLATIFPQLGHSKLNRSRSGLSISIPNRRIAGWDEYQRINFDQFSHGRTPLRTLPLLRHGVASNRAGHALIQAARKPESYYHNPLGLGTRASYCGS